ncbi:MAG: cysteine--tRNA ligase [Candidatus Omnitrophica bacterium]|nr:cysteine--tRNA ligase [Candidatus Omnitrophota bacterium]
MPISIYNSLTRKKEEFIPLSFPKVNIYTCGVTVYDESHIGHARSLFIFDLIRRYFKHRNFKVRFVRNITDIDDKIIDRANELKVSWRGLVRKYIKSYRNDLKALRIKRGDYEPCATDNIAEMIKYIKSLIEKGYAYQARGDVYFNVRKFHSYGALSGQSIEEMQKAVRIEPNDLKKDPLDFALWKESKENEPYWSSPWGNGRPGWHIECSVMSQKFLKTKTLDIHAGGRDLIFPHHENEIAQAQALTGRPFAKYWIHHGLLTMNGQKMSKSLGNFITISDFIIKYNDADLLKMFFLSAHYSHPIDYTDAKIEEARVAKERVLNFMYKANAKKNTFLFRQRGRIKELEDLRLKFFEKMDDDFNTPEALACIFEVVSLANKRSQDTLFMQTARKIILEMAKILGLTFKPARRRWLISDEEIKKMVQKRNTARAHKDYALSDEIRVELSGKGVVLEDLKEGKTIWHRVYK